MWYSNVSLAPLAASELWSLTEKRLFQTYWQVDKGIAGYSATNAVLRCTIAVKETVGIVLVGMKFLSSAFDA